MCVWGCLTTPYSQTQYVLHFGLPWVLASGKVGTNWEWLCPFRWGTFTKEAEARTGNKQHYMKALGLSWAQCTGTAACCVNGGQCPTGVEQTQMVDCQAARCALHFSPCSLDESLGLTGAA